MPVRFRQESDIAGDFLAAARRGVGLDFSDRESRVLIGGTLTVDASRKRAGGQQKVELSA
jgi:hypothetical protein